MGSMAFKIPAIRERAKELQMALRDAQREIDEFFCSDSYMNASTHAAVLALQNDFHLAEKESHRDELRHRLQVISDCPLMHGENLAEIESYLKWTATERSEIFKGKKPVHGTYARFFHDAIDYKQQEAIRMLSILDENFHMEATAND